MSFVTFIFYFFICIFITLSTGLFSSICSCYFPFLLSWRAYYVVKSKRMQEILISEKRNRSKDSKTAPEDRNKMAFWGCIGWITTVLWTICFVPLLIYLYVMGIILPYEESMALLEQWSPLFMFFFRMEYLYFFGLIFILYQLDYSIGKYIHSKKS